MNIKLLLRTPLKSIITFLMVASASFVLVSRVVDYVATSTELSRLNDSYVGVIALDNGVPNTQGKFNGKEYYSSLPNTRKFAENTAHSAYIPPDSPEPLTVEQIAAFSDFPETSVDVRYMTAGLIREYRAIDDSYSPFYDWGFDYTARFVIEGTFEGRPDSSATLNAIANGIIPLLFTDIRVLAGSFRHLPAEGESATILTFAEQELVVNNYAHASDVNLLDNQNLGQELEQSLIVGERYILIGRYPSDALLTLSLNSTDPEEQAKIDSLHEGSGDAKRFENTEQFLLLQELIAEMNSDISDFVPLWLGDQDTKDFVFPVVPAKDLSDGFYGGETATPLNELIEIINIDPYTYDIVYTGNMRSIPRFNEGSMVICEGRALNPEDVNAAVVSWYFYETYGLNLGDTLTIELGDRFFPQYSSLGATAYIPERRSNFIETAEVEIVGVYLDTDTAPARNTNQFWCYGPNTIFVPMSLMPVAVPNGYEIRPGEFSVVVEDANDIENVLTSAEQLAEDMGLVLRFSDGGWQHITNGLRTSMQSAFVTMLLNIVAAAVALFLAVYLFVGRNRTNFAIYRALGMSQRDSLKFLVQPFVVLTFPAVIVGCAFGVVYASSLIQTLLNHISTVALCLLLLLAFLTVATLITLTIISKKNILSLLQSSAQKV